MNFDFRDDLIKWEVHSMILAKAQKEFRPYVKFEIFDFFPQAICLHAHALGTPCCTQESSALAFLGSLRSDEWQR